MTRCSMFDSDCREKMLVRLHRLTPESQHRWGRMTAPLVNENENKTEIKASTVPTFTVISSNGLSHPRCLQQRE